MKLKSLIAFAFVTLFFACKKQYTCYCEPVPYYSGATQYQPSSQTFSKKMTKKQAEAACKEIESSLLESYLQSCTICDRSYSCTIK